MELYFLNMNYKVIAGPIDEFTSAVWKEKYYEVGNDTIHLPKKFSQVARSAEYIRTDFNSSGECKCGRVDTVKISTGDDGECEVRGVLLEGLLSNCLVYRRGEVSGSVSECALGVLEDNMRSMPFEIDAENSDVISDECVLTWEWDLLSDWLYGVLRPYGASYEVKLHAGDEKPKFRIVKGEDKSLSAVFSTSYGNIISLEYAKETGKHYNFAFIEGGDGSISVVSKFSVDRREVYKSAKEISPDKYDTDEDYRKALRQKGEEEIARYPVSITLAIEAAEGVPPYYGEDYALGDICGVSDGELGIKTVLRLTSVDTVCEGGRVTVYPYFGETLRWRDLL